VIWREGCKDLQLGSSFQQQVPIWESLTNCRRRVLAKGLPAHKYLEAGGGTPCSHELPDTPCRLSLIWPRNRLESLLARGKWQPARNSHALLMEDLKKAQ